MALTSPEAPVTAGASAVPDDARTAAKGGASLLVLQGVGRLFGLLFVVVVTRQLRPEDFGRYSTVAALVLFGNFIADFGTSAAITRRVSRAPRSADDLLSGTLLGSLALGTVSYGAVIAFAALSYSSTIVADVAIGALGIPSAAMLSSFLGALDGCGLIARRATISALQTMLVAAGAIPVLLGTGVRGALTLMAVAPFVCLLIAGAAARHATAWSSGLRLDRARTIELLRWAAPYAATGGLAALTMRFDVVLLSIVGSAAETARYDLTLRLLEAGSYVSTALTAPLLFILSRRLGDGDKEGAQRAYSEAVRLLYLLGLPLSVGLFLLARPIVQVAFGPEFGGAALPFAIMGAAQWLTWLIATQSALIMAGDSMRRAVALGLSITGVTVAVDLCLVPAFGATGAAVAMVVSWTSSVVALDRFARRTAGVSTVLPSARVIVATGLMGTAVLALRGQTLIIPILVGGAVYVLGAWAFRAFTPADVARLVGLIRRKPAPTS